MKKKGTFVKGLLLYLLGVTSGMTFAAGIATYVNQLHLPFIKPPTRDAISLEQRKEEQREVVEFHQLLRKDQAQPVPLQEEEKTEVAPTRSFVFYLQIGAFRNENTAENLRAQLALSGNPTLINTSQTADGEALYRVWIGPFENEDKAQSTRAELALEGYTNVSLLKTAL